MGYRGIYNLRGDGSLLTSSFDEEDIICYMIPEEDDKRNKLRNEIKEQIL